MFCTECGNQLSLDSRFCSACGKPTTSNKSLAAVDGGSARFCALCGEQLSEGARFCMRCGGAVPEAMREPSVGGTSREPTSLMRQNRALLFVVGAVGAAVAITYAGVTVPKLFATSSALAEPTSSASSSPVNSHTVTPPPGPMPSVVTLDGAPSTPPTKPSATLTMPTTGPGALFPGATLSTSGLGPFTLGTAMATLGKAGHAVDSPSCLDRWTSSPRLERNGIILEGASALEEIHLHNSIYATYSGARVGMTVSELRAIYGSSLKTEEKDGEGGWSQSSPIVRVGSLEMVFEVYDENGDFDDSSRVREIALRQHSRGWLIHCG